MVEHRLSLGKKEWAALQPSIVAANTTLYATAAGVVVLGGGVGLASYAAYRWLQNNAGAIKWIKEHDDWIWLGARGLFMATPFGGVFNIWSNIQQSK